MIQVHYLKDIIDKPISGEWGDGEGDVAVLRTTNFTNDRIINYSEVVKRKIDKSKVEKKRLFPGDIIIEKSGGSPTQPVGRVVYFDDEGLFLCNNFTSVLRPKINIVHPKYLLYILFANHHFGNTNGFQNKTTGIINLQLARYIEETKIPLPPLPQQKKIAAILDTADAYRQKTKALIAKYDELTQSLFLDMFGDPVSNPKGWDFMELKDCTSKIGSGSTPRGGKEAYKEEGISLIRSMNIYDNQFKYDNLAFISDEQADKLKNVTVELNDVLFNITGASVCRCSIVPADILPARVNQHVSILRTKKNIVTPIFLSHLMISENVKRHLLKVGSAGGAIMEAITKEQLEKYLIPVPPISLQTQFAERVQAIETQKAQAQASLDKAEELFNSLLQRAFKGELV
jgi:type I restriction enzyme S subunit